MKHLFLLVIFVCIYESAICQIYFRQVNSQWDDQWDEWVITGVDTSDRKVIYRLSAIWPLRENWEEWRIASTEYNATIKAKWRGDVSNWELRNSQEIIQIRQLYRGDLNTWEIREGQKKAIVRTLYRDNANDWIWERNNNKWYMKTEFINDPRDWIIDDYAENDLAISYRLAMIFIALWQSLPK